MTGPGNEMPERAADGGHFRASQADRERAIEVLKTAFAEERLTKDAFDLRVNQAFASRTYAELAAVTSDLASPELIVTSRSSSGVGRGRNVARDLYSVPFS